ncbi:MAG: hypothetical protein JO230_07195 [Xanthobacteraceae bacterium]|nr:hypothetical protein [Xanthobacteraceae bacterium]
MQVSRTTPAKLRASGSFLEALGRCPQPILAFIEVAEDNYVPRGVELRNRLTERQFTALIPAGVMDGLLRDSNVLLVQPSVGLQPISPVGLGD